MGVLKAKVGGVWTEVISPGHEEIFVGPSDPGFAYDLWYDTDEASSPAPLVVSGSYTPTLTGIVVGAGGANAGSYIFIGGPNVGDRGLLWVQGRITFGTSGQTFPAANAGFAPPAGFGFDPNNFSIDMPGGRVALIDTGSAAYQGLVVAETASFARFTRFMVVGGSVTHGTVSPTLPFTWAAGDLIQYDITARAVRV